MTIRIEQFRISRFAFPRGRPIGDSQVRSDMHYIGALELESSAGHVGLGFFLALFHPLPAEEVLARVFRAEHWPALQGQHPFALANRVARPRGGNIRGSLFDVAIDQALWDLQAKQLDMPLYRLLGGARDRAPAYASGLEFHLSTDAMQAFFAGAAARGFRAFKLKVGHPELAWDLARLRAVREVVGAEATLMVDANEAWSPKEAIRRLHAYNEAGFKIFWVEDPCLRDDYAGLAAVSRALPWLHVVCGEYLDLRGKRLLLEHGATDILHIHGGISEGLRAGWLAAEYGVPVALGNTQFELGVHLACALPEVAWLEYSFLDYDQVIAEPVRFVDGFALAPERPGHGLALAT